MQCQLSCNQSSTTSQTPDDSRTRQTNGLRGPGIPTPRRPSVPKTPHNATHTVATKRHTTKHSTNSSSQLRNNAHAKHQSRAAQNTATPPQTQTHFIFFRRQMQVNRGSHRATTWGVWAKSCRTHSVTKRLDHTTHPAHHHHAPLSPLAPTSHHTTSHHTTSLPTTTTHPPTKQTEPAISRRLHRSRSRAAHCPSRWRTKACCCNRGSRTSITAPVNRASCQGASRS